VDGADAGAGEKSGGGLPGHGEVDGDGVAFFDAHGLEDVGDAADFAEEFGVGDEFALAWFVRFPDDSGLRGMVSRIERYIVG